ncbi:hypothetical protein PGT21_023217 [Puccinia graminis f. sp. tritici]|uniref:Uncharacterized protein n=1 Tax=Puccinia graminis f. sp. tritici TaxID=56615 RepID=A0A5B0P8K4_PUCGR|nr:hypothetical protein PGT21_023217 [Puccinia graminis f. sp. tritici]KAA1117145.1 hypothetical protein PGTUg99_036382 [Puccinia graminis f. sp. tritici]
MRNYGLMFWLACLIANASSTLSHFANVDQFGRWLPVTSLTNFKYQYLVNFIAANPQCGTQLGAGTTGIRHQFGNAKASLTWSGVDSQGEYQSVIVENLSNRKISFLLHNPNTKDFYHWDELDPTVMRVVEFKTPYSGDLSFWIKDWVDIVHV